MDTRRNDSCNFILFIALIIIIFGIQPVAIADDSEAVQYLIDSSHLPSKITSQVAEKAISKLKQSIKNCINKELIERVEYQIGTLYFKAGSLDMANKQLNQILSNPDCSELIRMCSQNMSGQIYRLMAKDKEALKTFESVIELSEKHLNTGGTVNNFTVLKLFCSAAFSKGEIYEVGKDFSSAIREYIRIFNILKKEKIDRYKNYAALAIDRASQLCLLQGNHEKYLDMAKELVKDYPDYQRTPIVSFEVESVVFLKSIDSEYKFTHGSVDAPTKVIAYLKSKRGNQDFQRITSLLEKLCTKYEGTYGGIILNYHYAWLLDLAGDRQKEIEVLEKVIKCAKEKNDRERPSKTVADYARVQQSILWGEKGEYNRALEIIRAAKPDPNNVHLTNLSDSVEKSLEILKREVPKDANTQQK